MTSIVLTERASVRVRELLDGVPREDASGPVRFGLRVVVESYGWAHRYRLSLAPGPGANEVVVRLDDLEIFVDGASAPLVDGVRIDYVETPSSAGFTFSGPRPSRTGQLPGGPGRPVPSAPPGPPEGVDPGLWERVEAALDDVRPYLWRDGGDVALVGIDGGTVHLALEGACSGCSASVITVGGVIEQRLTAAVPEIDRVVVVG